MSDDDRDRYDAPDDFEEEDDDERDYRESQRDGWLSYQRR